MRIAQSQNLASAAADAQPSDPARALSIDHVDYFAFSAIDVVHLAAWVVTNCPANIAVPAELVVKAKAILKDKSSRVRRASFSSEPDPGKGGDVAAACVPAPSPRTLKVAPKKTKGKQWPRMPDRGLPVKQQPRPGSFALTVLDVIAVAGEGGLDVAGIVTKLNDNGVEIESQDMEKSVTNSIYQTLKPKDLIERCERTDRQTFWRAVTP